MTTNQTLQIATELKDVARRMREREEIIQNSKRDVQAKVCDVVANIIEQGNDVALVRAKLGGVMTLDDWRAAHVPNLSKENAAKYEKVCKDQKEGLNGQVFLNLLEFYKPTTKTTEERAKASEREVFFGALNNTLNRFLVTFKRFDVGTWSGGELTVARSAIEPIARKLWPERF